ncbi:MULTISPECIES: GPW/gp25 family protein [unclassified Streptomyces]|uniref:GPW/gp25 family protein n=1 Tax=unclassified Streptomyces TaxID=2593676 RepID=UPI002E804280|nr:GPW/gp25 family protein [Streptomyces sp. NBC_00569]WUB92514.1 GPW/gp25 family protein [Streptomyces sp. NBC_00569]
MDPDIHGRGIAFPMRLGTAGLNESAGLRKIQESIRIILETQYGERVMRPDFGCNLKRLLFAPNNEATASLARYYVEEGLTRWEPRIDILDVTVTNDGVGAALRIDISYRVRATGAADQVVHPFPLERSP